MLFSLHIYGIFADVIHVQSQKAYKSSEWKHAIAPLSEDTASITVSIQRTKLLIFPKRRTTTSVATKTLKLNQDHLGNNVTVYVMVT